MYHCLVVLGLIVITHEVTIVTRNVGSYSTQLIAEQASSRGFKHVSVASLQHVISALKGMEEEEAVVLVDKTDILINNDTFSFTPRSIVTAASATCKSPVCLNKDAVQYVDSRVVMGYSSDITTLLTGLSTHSNLQDHLSKLHLESPGSPSVRIDPDMILDVDERYKDVSLHFEERKNTLRHKDKVPCLVRTGGASIGSRFFSEISRYVGNGVTQITCNTCKRSPHNHPKLFLALYITKNAGFISNLLNSIDRMKYDKSKIEIVVFCLLDSPVIRRWKPDVAKYTLINEDFEDDDHDTRYYLLDLFRRSEADFFVYVDGTVHITSSTIPQLLKYNKPVVTPLLTLRNGTTWANFWGSHGTNWSYKRSADYANIFTRTVKGLYRVPCVRNMYVVRRDAALLMYERDVYDNHVVPDISVCKTLTEHNVPVYVDNTLPYGWLKNEVSGRSDLALYTDYQDDWTIRYKATPYQTLDARSMSEPCPKVYRTQLFRPVFGADLIQEMERVGKWKIRLGRYRPAVDLTETALNSTITSVIHNMTRDAVSALFPGYQPDGVLYDAFVFKVTNENLPKVRGHIKSHDHGAAYHVIVPLNQPDDTLVGGGYAFARHSCAVTDYKTGEVYIFPGYITHYPAAVRPDAGTHYYLHLSFDPPR